MIDTDLPNSQLDPVDQRDDSNERYTHSLKAARSGRYLTRNLDQVHIALEILQIAKCVEDVGDSEGVTSSMCRSFPAITVFKIKKDGTWEGYRQHVLLKYGINMGPVPDDAEKPSSKIIEGTIQNWLNGEPLLFY